MTEEERLNERLKAYYSAEMAVLSSQSYSVGGKTLTRANLAEIRATIEKLENKLKQIENYKRNGKTKRVVPLDF